MEMGKFVLLLLCVGLLTETNCVSAAAFKDCYTNCFILCMIEPAETLCSCTTHCFKECIFQETPSTTTAHQGSQNIGFCKLGCAFATCSGISTKNKPNGDMVDGCVGSCSTRCIKSYTSP